MAAIEASGCLSLFFIQGSVEGEQGKEWEAYGPPPNLCFYDETLMPVSLFTPLRRGSANSVVRSYDTDKGGNFPAQESVRKTVEKVKMFMAEKGPFDGVIGFSEGGSLAATVLVEDQDNARKGLSHNSLRCGIFFNAYPPFTSDGKKLMLSDEFGQPIQAPTLHVLSGSDSFFYASRALSQLCSQEQCTIYEHSEGHAIPWKPVVARPLGAEIKRFLETIRRRKRSNIS